MNHKELSVLEELCFSTTLIEAWNAKGCKFTSTGFFFILSVENKPVPLLVTNKHVVNNMVKMQFTISSADDKGNLLLNQLYTHKIEKNLVEKWIFHPDPQVDLCVMPFAPICETIRKKGISPFVSLIDYSYIPSKEAMNELDAIEDIIMIGYPNNLCDAKNNLPIVRKGITATQISFDFNGKKEFLIDAACFWGSSGSPIFLYNKGGYSDKKGIFHAGISRIYLLGILYAGPLLPIKETTSVDFPFKGKINSFIDIPYNLGYAIKAERLLDFVDIIEHHIYMLRLSRKTTK